jgi:serine/threonine protein kinase
MGPSCSHSRFISRYIVLIVGHRSLLEDARILHRDISTHNIIINETDSDRTKKGFLIDLDFATRVGPDYTAEGPSGAPHRTGTLPFMAIGALRGDTHTYRHDLESFLYVFLWICIAYAEPGKKVEPLPDILQEWSMGNYIGIIASSKFGKIVEWTEIEDNFSQYFAGEGVKQIARGMRRALFGENGTITGTPEGDVARDRMYRGMLDALCPNGM